MTGPTAFNLGAAVFLKGLSYPRPRNYETIPSATRNAEITNLFDMDHFSVNLFTSYDNSRGFLRRPSSIAASNTTIRWNAIAVFPQSNRSTSVLVARPGDVSAIGPRTLPRECGLF